VSGGSLYRKSSFLVDSLGEQVFAPLVHIREEPHLQRARGSAPFDNEGVATRAAGLVTAGVLQGISWAAIRRGSSVSRPRAMRAAHTTS
jgi:PmbA protein